MLENNCAKYALVILLFFFLLLIRYFWFSHWRTKFFCWRQNGFVSECCCKLRMKSLNCWNRNSLISRGANPKFTQVKPVEFSTRYDFILFLLPIQRDSAGKKTLNSYEFGIFLIGQRICVEVLSFFHPDCRCRVKFAL